MKNKKIIEAYDRMLPSKERQDKNLEQIISRLNAMESGEEAQHLRSAEDDSSRTAELQKTNAGRKWMKRVAAAAVILLAAFGIVFAASSEVRAGVLYWLRHENEDHPNSYDYEFREGFSGKKLPQIIIGWLPEDFENVEPRIGALDDEYTFSRAYETEKGRRIDFLIDYMDRGNTISVFEVPDDELQLEELTVNGKRADLYEDSYSTALLVFDDVNGIVITIRSYIERDEVIKIAENIQFVFD